jgi:hypothetical protein
VFDRLFFEWYFTSCFKCAYGTVFVDIVSELSIATLLPRIGFQSSLKCLLFKPNAMCNLWTISCIYVYMVTVAVSINKFNSFGLGMCLVLI